MARVVTKLWAILIGVLIVLSFGMGSVAHAMEPVTCIEESAAASAHGNDVPAPADDIKSDPAMHGHGGCHGHHLATPGGEAASGDMTQSGSLRSVLSPNMLAAIDLERTLRPPIA